MPRQDASGWWISDDGRFYWDGTAWKPVAPAAPPAPAAPAQPAPVVPAQPAPAYAYAQPAPAPARPSRSGFLIGCLIAVVIAVVLLILGSVAVASSPDFQRSFCSGWSKQNPNPCPFHPPSPS